MANLALNDIWRVRIVSHAGDQVAVNVVNFLVSALTGDITDVELADYFDNEWSALFRGVLSDDANYRGVSVQRIWPTPVTRPAINTDGAAAGSVVGEILPRQVSGILTFYTAFAGPKYRGRMYLPFPSEASSEPPGRPTAAYVAAATSLGGQIIDADTVVSGGNSATLNLVIFHRETNTWDVVQGGVARPRWATQKRRGDYGSQNQLPF